MIFVDRNRIDKPSIFKADEFAASLREAETYFAMPERERGQRRYRPRRAWENEPEVREALAGLFHGKCAFCERKLPFGQADTVGRYRPELRAIDLRGSVFPDHYWWLMYEWANLYPVCAECCRLKGSRFPILGERAAPGARGAVLLLEQPLLLDPCADQPEQHLAYSPDGQVASSSRQGQITIEMLGLNRGALIEERRQVYARYETLKNNLLTRVESGAGADDPEAAELLEALRHAGDADQPFAGMMRQYLTVWMPSFQRFAEQSAQLGSIRKTGAVQEEAGALYNLGMSAYASADYARAGDYFHQALAIAKEEGDRGMEGRATQALGLCLQAQKLYGEAIEHFKEALEIAEEIEDAQAAQPARINLGLAYTAAGEQRQALKWFEEALEEAGELDDPKSELVVLLNMANTYLATGSPRQAVEFYERALDLARALGDGQAEQSALNGLGNAHAALGEADQAQNYYIEQSARPKSPTLVEEVEVDRPQIKQAYAQTTFQQFDNWKSNLESYDLAGNLQTESYFSSTRLIDRLEIRNFKVIEDLDLDLSDPQTGRAPWMMLLGENGSGKSSVLQAVTLALVGQRYRARLPVRPEDVLRYEKKSGYVRVYLTGSSRPIELRFREDSDEFESDPAEPKALVLAYGATRLLPRPGTKPLPGTEYAHVDNMFNPFVPLRDATQWLLKMDEDHFQTVARALKDLLALEDDAELVRKRGRKPAIQVRNKQAAVPLTHLSDGYQSVLALSADIMAVMLELWKTPEIAEGIVLIDELGAHLHPRWRMRIVQSLRQAFPRIQFLASTHDPLCLRGLSQGEVTVMRLTPDFTAAAVTDLPPVEGMRVDQLLTSEHFGLFSTIDPDVDALFQEYYALLAAYKRTPAQSARLSELKEALAKYNQFGSNRRERMMLEVIDSYLAQEPQITDLDQREALETETRRKAQKIWASMK